ncbi:DnaB-like helicase C-terminal domain-containing protein [Arthrobacter sp. SIMBA_036]|uniref:replicative DNA helicase n=1 Tax=Arthrobacter sp. SIMBA_036 TaxID=3085778 RepID=UPI00397A0EDB
MTTDLKLRQDIDAERAVIGAVLLDQRTLDEVELKAEDFYLPQHEQLWHMILTEARGGRPASALAMSQKLVSCPIVGMEPAYLHQCLEAAPVRSAAAHYASIITGTARLRRLAEVGRKLQQMSDTAGWDETEAVLDQARVTLDATANEATGIRVRTFSAALEDAVNLWSAPKGKSYPTGWSELDHKFNGGWHPGQLTVMGARPAVGKSLVAGCAAVAASKYGVGFFSLEMKEHEVVGRMAAASEGIDLHKINSHNLGEAEWAKIARLTQKAADWPVYIEEASRITMAQIRATVRTWARRRPVPLIIIDYLQLCAPADPRDMRERQVSRIAEDCKHLAKEFDTHVLALAQVNRGSTQRTDTRPTMADLRESGGIEAHADNIILLHRDDQEMEGELELIIEKNRHGQTGKIRLAWRPHFASVNSMSIGPNDYRYGMEAS